MEMKVRLAPAAEADLGSGAGRGKGRSQTLRLLQGMPHIGVLATIKESNQPEGSQDFALRVFTNLEIASGLSHLDDSAAI
jgi:hypothetical protein